MGDGGNRRGACVGEYIRVRFRLRPALVGSPPRAQIRGKNQAKTGAKQPRKYANKRPSILPIIDASRPYNVAQTAKRPSIGRPNVGQASAILNGRELIRWYRMRLRAGVSLPVRRCSGIVRRPATIDVGRRYRPAADGIGTAGRRLATSAGVSLPVAAAYRLPPASHWHWPASTAPVAPQTHKSAADLANGRRRLGGVWGGV
jgi:hypothetical protein